MKNSLKNNIKLTASLALLLLLLLAQGFTAILLNSRSSQKREQYNEAIDLTHKVEISFRTQIAQWNTLTRSSQNSDLFREYYYNFSKSTDQIQDYLFNLKALFANNKELSDKFNKIRNAHKGMTDKYLTYIYKTSMLDSKSQHLEIEDINRKNENILPEIEEILSTIKHTANEELSNTNEFYQRILVISFILISAVFILCIIQITFNYRKQQKKDLTLQNRLGSYLPSQLVLSLFDDDDMVNSNASRKYLTICFTDLQGFTSFSENIEPETMMNLLDEYLTDMAIIAQSWGGMIDKFMGDGIMIIFGAFDSSDASITAQNCINMAMAMQHRMLELQNKWTDSGYIQSIKLRIGIHSGYATVGSIGPSDRRSFTAIGNTINISSRLEKLCTPGKILLSQDTFSQLENNHNAIKLPEQIIKGISRNIQLYEISINN